MIPTKQQFQELTTACHSDRLSASLKLIFGNENESRIRAFIEGYESTLNIAFSNYINPLPAYKWLSRQQPFRIAQNKAFPLTNKISFDNEAATVIASIIKHTEESFDFKTNFTNYDKACFKKGLTKRYMHEIANRMQARHYWIGLVSKCLCAYHYPDTPEIGKMRKKCIEAGQRIEAARQAILEITAYSDYMPWLSLPDHGLDFNLNRISTLLQPENIKDLIPIQRADSSLMERLFVIQLANGHARHLRRDDGMPAVIADLFYLEGFISTLDERTIRRICNEQQKRRHAGKQKYLETQTYSSERQKSQADG